MLKRIITSIVSICVLLPVLFLSDTVVLPTVVAIFTFVALYEMFKCIGNSKNISLCIPTYILAVVTPFLSRYLKERFISIVFVCAVVFLSYLFTICVTSKGKVKFEEIGELYLVSLYIVAAFNSIIYIRDLDKGNYIYLLIFIGAWITDIFAYFCGMLFGKHKLIPEVSPKKTVEGSIGGTIFCVISFIVFGIIVNTIDKSINVNYILLAIGALLVAVVAQIGDLIMSVIKRQYGVKDYGKLFPGHGGVLDRFDSILAVSLIICAICVFSDALGIVFIGGAV